MCVNSRLSFSKRGSVLKKDLVSFNKLIGTLRYEANVEDTIEAVSSILLDPGTTRAVKAIVEDDTRLVEKEQLLKALLMSKLQEICEKGG